MLGSQSEDKGVSLLLDDKFLNTEIVVFGDEHAIKRALINLMSNAVKFSPKNGVVTVGVAQVGLGPVRHLLAISRHSCPLVVESCPIDTDGCKTGCKGPGRREQAVDSRLTSL